MPNLEQLILWSAQHANILPITSTCNCACLFCSHQQNPPEVHVYRTPPRTLSQIEQTMNFLSPRQKIVIGESATKIIEGEPFSHPKILEILVRLRAAFPGTLVQITTNGTYLSRPLIASLEELQPIELNISLNSANPAKRELLMRDRRADTAIEGVRLLGKSSLAFHGSIVAVPMVVGWEDIRATVLYLEQCGARTIRIFAPGFTRLAPEGLKFTPRLFDELRGFVRDLQEKTSVPLLMEPPCLTDLCAVIEGVINGSPAAACGLRRGDIILAVDGLEVWSRVHAWEMVLRKGKTNLTVRRGNEILQVPLDKPRGTSPGFVMSYDFAPEMVKELVKMVRRLRLQRILLLASPLAEELCRLALSRCGEKNFTYEVVPVASHFFGGSIMAAGLLVVEDFDRCLQAYLPGRDHPDCLVLPQIAFDPWGRDLTGKSYLNLEEKWGIKTVLV